MSKKSILPQGSHHILVYDEDWEYLETRFGYTGLRPIGVSNVIKALIHKYVLKWREAENAAATAAARLKIQHESMETKHGNPTDIGSPDGGATRVDL